MIVVSWYRIIAILLLLGSIGAFVSHQENPLSAIFVLLLAIFWLIMSIAEKSKDKA